MRIRWRDIGYIGTRIQELSWMWPEIRTEWREFAKSNKRVLTNMPRDTLNGRPAMMEAWTIVEEIMDRFKSKRKRRR